MTIKKILASHFDGHDQVIIDMRKAGKSLREISNATGMAEPTISKRINRLKLPHFHTNPRKVEHDKEVIRRRAMGETINEIAKALKVDEKVVRRRVKINSIPNISECSKPPRKKPLLNHEGVFFHHRKDGMSFKDIAIKYGVRENNVRRAIKRHEEKLKGTPNA